MTIPPLARLFALYLSSAFFASAAAEKADAGASGADAAWAAIEKEMEGPGERPNSQEEAFSLMRDHIARVDRMAVEFADKYPADPRRWRIVTQLVSTFPMRGAVGLPAKTTADARKVLAEVLAAKDADRETREEASFRMVLLFGEERKAGNVSLEDLEKAVAAHRSAFPDFKGNPQLGLMLAAAKAEEELRSKPIEMKFTAVDGRTVDLAAMRGKVVLVDFWATWCGPCMAEIPSVVKTYEKLRGRGFEIVGISFDEDRAKLESVTKEKGMTWPQHFDGKGWRNEFGERFGIDSIPRMWLVDKRGMLADTEARADLAAKVEKLLAE
jgi:thiol-disulfide isomerase/thioredoxin